MRRIATFLTCLLFSAMSVASAQGFRVSVHNDIKEPLPHAYVYVNELAVAATDSLGWAVIPLGKLQLRDTISVSYVATKGGSVVVDHDLLTKGEYHFILDETHGVLHADAVVVKANIAKLYRKALPLLRFKPCAVYTPYSAHFTMNVTNPGDSLPSRWVVGRMHGIYTSTMYLRIIRFPIGPPVHRRFYHPDAAPGLNPDPAVLDSLQRRRSGVGFVHNIPLTIITNDDTTGVSNPLKYYLPRALHASHLALYRIYDPEPDYKELAIYPDAKVSYGYFGKQRHHRTFRLTYSGHGAGTTSHIEVISDVEDNINRRVVGATLRFVNANNNSGYDVEIKTETKAIGSHLNAIGVSVLWQVPTELTYRIQESDGTVVKVMMSNIFFGTY